MAGTYTGVGSEFELTFWQSIASSDDPAQLDAYLATYPNGTFSNLARVKIAALRRRDGVQPVAAPALPATPSPIAAGDVPAQVTPPAQVAAPIQATAAVMVPATPEAAAPVPAAPPAPPPTLVEQLRQIAASQAQPGADARRSGLTLPPAPQLAPLPAVKLPDRFCSAVERNLFHDTVYKVAMDVADRNNRAAIAHLEALQGIYDDRSKVNDMAAMNIVSAAAMAYKPVATEAFNARAAYDGIFVQLLAVPIRPCPLQP